MSGAAPGGTGDPIICVAGSLNFSESPPWAAGIGRLWKRKRAGGKAVKLEYAGTDAFVAYCRLAASSSSSPPVAGMFSWYLLLFAPRLGTLFALLLS